MIATQHFLFLSHAVNHFIKSEDATFNVPTYIHTLTFLRQCAMAVAVKMNRTVMNLVPGFNGEVKQDDLAAVPIDFLVVVDLKASLE